MKKAGTMLIVLTAILLTLNLADVVSTWIALNTGRGIEANPFVTLLGGPFSPIAFFLKLFVVPVAILGVAWWLAYRSKDAKVGMVAIIAPAAVYAAAVANNVIVAAKKVKKTVARKG